MFRAHLRKNSQLSNLFSNLATLSIQRSIQAGSVPSTPIEWNNHPGCPSPVDLQHGLTITKSWLDMEELSGGRDNGRVAKCWSNFWPIVRI